MRKLLSMMAFAWLIRYPRFLKVHTVNDHIVINQNNNILGITINRPERKNALTLDMYRQMTQAIIDAQGNSGVRVISIVGSDECFTSGNDLQDFLQEPPDMDSPVALFMQALSQCPLPVVAGVAGPAIGIGTTLLLHCDLVLAANNANFQLPFANLGLTPEFACSLILPQLVGRVKAAELLMLGEFFDAHIANSLGIVNRVVESSELINTTHEYCEKLASKPPASLRVTKQLMQNNTLNQNANVMKEEFSLFLQRLKSEEFEEAANAFFEKRAADFSRFS